MGRIKYGKNSTNFSDEWVKSFSTAEAFVKANEGKGALSFVADKAKREQMLKDHWAQVTGAPKTGVSKQKGAAE